MDNEMADTWRELRNAASKLSRNAASSRGNDTARREGVRHGFSGERLALIVKAAAQKARAVYDEA